MNEPATRAPRRAGFNRFCRLLLFSLRGRARGVLPRPRLTASRPFIRHAAGSSSPGSSLASSCSRLSCPSTRASPWPAPGAGPSFVPPRRRRRSSLRPLLPRLSLQLKITRHHLRASAVLRRRSGPTSPTPFSSFASASSPRASAASSTSLRCRSVAGMRGPATSRAARARRRQHLTCSSPTLGSRSSALPPSSRS